MSRESEQRERERQARARKLEEEFESVRRFIRGTLSEICRAYGIAPLPLVFVPNGNASSDGHGIRANVAWFLDLLKRHCDDASCTLSVARWILAHEVAHHVHGDAKVPAWIRSAHSMELRADYFGGRALAERVNEFEKVIGRI